MSAGKHAPAFPRDAEILFDVLPNCCERVGVGVFYPPKRQPRRRLVYGQHIASVITGPTPSFPIISEKVHDKEGPSINY